MVGRRQFTGPMAQWHPPHGFQSTGHRSSRHVALFAPLCLTVPKPQQSLKVTRPLAKLFEGTAPKQASVSHTISKVALIVQGAEDSNEYGLLP